MVLEDVVFAYPGREELPALAGISLEVREGELLAVTGANGSGKSTLCRLINALYLPTRGRVLACGLDTLRPENLAEVRRRVGLILQNPDNQIVGPTVEDDVAFGPENLALPREEVRSRVEEALAAMQLTSLRGREPHLLSVGERKRLALAGALALHPRVLVSDESTSLLDPSTRAEIISLFSRLREERGVTIIHVTHRSEEILAAQRVAILERGRLLFLGTPRELFADGGLAAAHGLRPPVLYELERELEARGFPFDVPSLEPEEVARRLWASS